MTVRFRKVLIADERYESAAAFDVTGDGALDIVSGEYWYEGPDYKRRHRIGDVQAAGEYYDDFCTIPLDVNGDGRLDFVTGGVLDAEGLGVSGASVIVSSAMFEPAAGLTDAHGRFRVPQEGAFTALGRPTAEAVALAPRPPALESWAGGGAGSLLRGYASLPADSLCSSRDAWCRFHRHVRGGNDHDREIRVWADRHRWRRPHVRRHCVPGESPILMAPPQRP